MQKREREKTTSKNIEMLHNFRLPYIQPQNG